MKTDARSVKLFYSYAHRDRRYKDELAKHLGRSYISEWHDREILPGSEWEQEIDQHLQKADIILLLVSVDFLASDYCYGYEMRRALERQVAGETIIIPIILRPVAWVNVPFAHLQVLPRSGKPIASWANRDEAFSEVAQGIRSVINQVLKKRSLADAELATVEGRYEDARLAYEQIINLFPDESTLHKKLADTLLNLQRYEQALSVIEKAIELDLRDASLYISKARVLTALKQWEEALSTYKQAEELGISDSSVYQEMGDVLTEMARYAEALHTYEKAIRLSPKDQYIYAQKAKVLKQLGRSEEALWTLEQAIHIAPVDAQLYVNKGDLLVSSKYYQEALDAYEVAIALGPDNAQLWRTKGITLDAIGKFEDARNAYEKAIDLDPNNPYVYKESGYILIKL